MVRPKRRFDAVGIGGAQVVKHREAIQVIILAQLASIGS